MEECLTIQILWKKRKFTTFEISKYIDEYPKISEIEKMVKF